MEENDRAWKRPIPERQYRFAEGILFRYSELKEDVAYWEEDMILSSRKPDDGMPKGTGTSDPTSKMALSLDNPPLYIREKKKHIDAVNMLIELLKQTENLYTIANEYYSLEKPIYTHISNSVLLRNIADKHYMSESTMRRTKDQIVFLMWQVCLWKRLIEPELA